MKVEVRQFPAYHVAYVRHFEGFDKGEYSKEISGAFDKVAKWVDARDLFRKDTLCLGVTYDNLDLTDREKCRYDAALTVPEQVTDGGGEVGIQDVPGGKYAVCRIEVENGNGDAFQIAIQQLGMAVDYIYGEWLPGSGYELEDRPCLELYLTTQDAPIIQIDCCVPVRAGR